MSNTRNWQPQRLGECFPNLRFSGRFISFSSADIRLCFLAFTPCHRAAFPYHNHQVRQIFCEALSVLVRETGLHLHQFDQLIHAYSRAEEAFLGSACGSFGLRRLFSGKKLAEMAGLHRNYVGILERAS